MFRSPTVILLAASHLVAVCLAWAVARNTLPPSGHDPEMQPRTKSTNRDLRTQDAGTGAVLLAEFQQMQSDERQRFQKLAESLPPAADMQAAVAAAIADWFEPGTSEERAGRQAVIEARMLQWMRQNPGGAMDYLGSALPSEMEAARVLGLLSSRVFPEIISENGLLASLDWMKKSPVPLSALLPHVAAREIEAGGGLALFMKLEEAIGDLTTSQSSNFNGGWHDFDADLRDFHRSVGKALRFEEKDRLLEYVREQADATKQHELLLGFAQSGEAATTWLLDLIDRGGLDEELAGRLRGALGNEVLSKPGMEMDARVQARRATKGNETKNRQSIINELVGGDVNRLLVNGRDWRYEFRTGVSSLDEIVGAVREGLPGLPAEGEEALQVSLYRHLAEENPAKALPLLDELPEEKRREVLFGTTWQAFTNNDPDIYLRFLNSLPEPVTEHERAERIKGWDWKARGFLSRYGNDYVEWVRQMPPGLDKDRAMNSLVWATREQDPAKARELAETLYPKNP